MAEHIKKAKNCRLGRNFHRTFIPERQYLAALLKYAANNGIVDMQAIADATGIPTGASSGKAMPTGDYCLAMGLVDIKDENKQKIFSLTPYGRTVLLGDRFFREPITQWLAHLQMCNKDTGAEVWYQIFWKGSLILGGSFTRNQLQEFLETNLKAANQNIIGPAIRMYEDEASFLNCGALKSTGDHVVRRKAPLDSSFAYGYAAWITAMVEKMNKSGNQVTVDELEQNGGWKSITNWNLRDSQLALSHMEQKGLISVDRHMTPWIIRNLYTAENLWKRLYDDLI